MPIYYSCVQLAAKPPVKGNKDTADEVEQIGLGRRQRRLGGSGAGTIAHSVLGRESQYSHTYTARLSHSSSGVACSSNIYAGFYPPSTYLSLAPGVCSPRPAMSACAYSFLHRCSLIGLQSHVSTHACTDPKRMRCGILFHLALSTSKQYCPLLPSIISRSMCMSQVQPGAIADVILRAAFQVKGSARRCTNDCCIHAAALTQWWCAYVLPAVCDIRCCHVCPQLVDTSPIWVMMILTGEDHAQQGPDGLL